MAENMENKENNCKQNGTLDSHENTSKIQANSTNPDEIISETQHEIQNTEIDPCLDTKKPTKKDSSYRQHFENYVNDIQKRTGLTRRGVFLVGFLVIFVLLLVTTVILMAVTWPRIPHKYQYPVCTESACLRASAQVAETLNTSVSPCHDLWGAFCAGWGRNITRPLEKIVWNQKQRIAQKDLEKVKDLISTLPLPLHTGTVEWKLKYLYEACMDVDSRNQEEARSLTTAISELGDSGYALRNYLLTPLAEPQGRGQVLYNEAHIRTRNVSEHTNGVLKRRFPVLAYGIRLKLETALTVIVACGVLDNIARNRNEPEPPLGDEMDWEQLKYLIKMGNIPEQPENFRGGNHFLYRNEVINYFEGLH